MAASTSNCAFHAPWRWHPPPTRYFLRVADQSKPVTGDDVMRLASERSALPWETQTTLHIPRTEADAAKHDKLLQALRASDRVKPSVKACSALAASITAPS